MISNTCLRIYTFGVLSLIFTACNGQSKTPAQNNKVSEQTNVSNAYPKLTRTQGTDEYVTVSSGMQDKVGNLWFTTTGEGVYRYDGGLFTQFTVKDGLSSNKVWSILEDASGTIWFGTTNGACQYDGQKITPVSIIDDYAPRTSNDDYYNDWSTRKTVWCMLQDKNGKIWFGTGDGVYCYQDNRFTRFPDNDSIINKEGLHLRMVDCMIEDRNGNIWLASGMLPGQEGLCRFDGKTISRFKPGGDSWIRYVLEDKNGIIWSAGRHYGNWCYDGKTFTKFTEKEGIGAPLLVDKAGNIWFSREVRLNGHEDNVGVWRYDGKSFENFTAKDGIINYGVWSITDDKAGNIWIGTRNNGLYKYDGKTFTSYSE
jgi:ligand-binding sensor domain-containing protein